MRIYDLSSQHASVPSRPAGTSAKLAITCVAWRTTRRGSLLGFAKIVLPGLGGLTFHDVAVHRRGDATWAALPSKPWVQDGASSRTPRLANLVIHR